MARKSLIKFTEYTLPEYSCSQHHEKIAAALERVERGECKRLMIFMPPRHGKSELTSRRFPAWFLGRNPDRQIIACSYNSDLANDFGREVRNIVGNHEYQSVFEGIELAKDSKAADRWHTREGGSYVAAGVGTSITGRGAHILLIDDPVKDREEADSEVSRKKVWNWYTSTAYTRLMPGGAVVLIQTRWHEDDLAGRLKEAEKNGTGDKWEVLELPAIDNRGQALWPAWYPFEVLEQIRSVIGLRDWNALYQQEPTPDEGTYFKRKWFLRYDILPRGLNVYGASDYAVTEDGGDYTVHGVFGIDEFDDIYVLDWYFDQTETIHWIDAYCRLVNKWKPIEWAEEQGQILKSVGPFLKKKIRKTGAYTFRRQFTSAKDKTVRARSIQGRISETFIYWPRKQWADEAIERIIKFPTGTIDDDVDVLSLFGRMMAEVIPGKSNTHVPKKDITATPTFNMLRDLVRKRRLSGRT
jgi:predicted phage terminase large subunit-like protein